MKPKDWLPGMTIKASNTGKELLLGERLPDKYGSPYFKCYDSDGCVLDGCYTFHDNTVFRPATYADLGRGPREGERAVWVEACDCWKSLVGDIYEWRTKGAFGPAFYEVDDEGIGWQLSDYKTIFAPLAEQPREPQDKAYCHCGATGDEKCLPECTGPEQLPEPAECERVARARRELDERVRDLPTYADGHEEWFISEIGTLADEWCERYDEFTPCHELYAADPHACDPCAACRPIIDAAEAKAEKPLQSFGQRREWI